MNKMTAMIAAASGGALYRHSPYRGVSNYDRGATYTDNRYLPNPLTFEKFDNGAGIWGYRLPQGTIINGITMNGGFLTDAYTNASFVDPLKELWRVTIPGGTLVHNNKVIVTIPITSTDASNVPATFNGAGRLQITDNFNQTSVFDFTYTATSLTSKTVTLEMTAEDTSILIVKSGIGVTTASGGYVRLLNLLSDLTIKFFYTFTGQSGKKVFVDGANAKATYTVVQNTMPVGGTTYRDPRITPFSADSFWNTPLSNSATYANPATDIATQHVRDQYAGKKLKSGSTTNYFWVGGQSGDGIPINNYDVSHAVSNLRINNVATGRIRSNVPIPFFPYDKAATYASTDCYFRFKLPALGLVTGQSSDRITCLRTQDNRFVFEMGRYHFLPQKWVANGYVEQFGHDVLPTNKALQVYRYTNNGAAGACGATEPAWNTVIGGSTVDGAVTWTCAQNADMPWSASKAFSSGNVVFPTATVQNGFRYSANGSGVTGSTEPVWPTIINNTVVDGTITWKCVASGLNNQDNMHSANTLYTADIYGKGMSKKFYPWTSTTIINSSISGYAYQHFHRAGGLPAHGGLVTKAQLDAGLIDHVVGMQASGVMLRATTFSVVSATSNAGGSIFVIKPISATYDAIDYSQMFTAGTLFGHSATVNTNSVDGTQYSVHNSIAATFDASTGYTTVTVNEVTVTSTGSTIAIGFPSGDNRVGLQSQWPCFTADSIAATGYFGYSKMGEMYAIPKAVDLNSLGLTAEGLILAKALQDYGGMIVDYTGTTFAVCQISSDVVNPQKSNLVADKIAIIGQLTRVTNYTSALVVAAQTEAAFLAKPPILPFY